MRQLKTYLTFFKFFGLFSPLKIVIKCSFRSTVELLKCEYFLVSLVSDDNNLNIFDKVRHEALGQWSNILSTKQLLNESRTWHCYIWKGLPTVDIKKNICRKLEDIKVQWTLSLKHMDDYPSDPDFQQWVRSSLMSWRPLGGDACLAPMQTLIWSLRFPVNLSNNDISLLVSPFGSEFCAFAGSTFWEMLHKNPSDERINLMYGNKRPVLVQCERPAVCWRKTVTVADRKWDINNIKMGWWIVLLSFSSVKRQLKWNLQETRRFRFSQ